MYFIEHAIPITEVTGKAERYRKLSKDFKMK